MVTVIENEWKNAQKECFEQNHAYMYITLAIYRARNIVHSKHLVSMICSTKILEIQFHHQNPKTPNYTIIFCIVQDLICVPYISFQPLSVQLKYVVQIPPYQLIYLTAVQHNIIIWQCYSLESSALREGQPSHVMFGWQCVQIMLCYDTCFRLSINVHYIQ